MAVAVTACTELSHCLVEAERFDDYGGWVRDDQFYDQLGSSYLMAHGMGVPVEDASTVVTLPSSGMWNVWVKTHNWNARWDARNTPCLFSLSVNGEEVCDSLGAFPSEWGWVKAGRVRVPDRRVTLTLHDLTGFNGKCDAVFFTKSDTLDLPERKPCKKVVEKKDYDLIVAGGGMAGLCAAISASRMGIRTLILQDRPVLGGNSSVENMVGINGAIMKPPYENMGRVLAEYGRPFDAPSKVDSLLACEDGLDILCSHRVVGAETKDGRITSVTAVNLNDGLHHVFRAKFYADCTGDAVLGYLAGAEYMSGQESCDRYGEDLAPEKPYGLSFGSTLRWYARRSDEVSGFPLCPWAVSIDESSVQETLDNKWYWETGFYLDQIKDAEQIRDSWFRYIYGNWSYLKNTEPYRTEYADASLKYVSYVLAKRESRRLKGDVVFTQNDIIKEDWRRYDDPAVYCSYPVDQHFPAGEYKSIQKHCYNPAGPLKKKLPGVNINNPSMLPYRALYSRNIENLFMAGRNVSVTRIALASTRVAGSTSMMGEAVGIASSLCVKYGCSPRELYSGHLDELIEAFRKGVPSRHEVTYVPRPF